MSGERLADVLRPADNLVVAGNLACEVSRGALGPLYRSSEELIRRIFLTVRDSGWSEVSPCDWRIEPTDSGVRIVARHTTEDIDFRWEGQLALSADGRSADFRFKGQALRDMSVCRLGLIVLLPVERVVGSHLAVDGIPVATDVSRNLAPQPIVDGLPSGITEPFSQLTLGSPDSPDLVLQFEGDLFELEDQRNWGDASFKVYCTPLRLGFPRPVAAGAVVEHAVRMSFGECALPATATPAASGDPKGPAISIEAGPDDGEVRIARRVTRSVRQLPEVAPAGGGAHPALDLELSASDLQSPELPAVLKAHGGRLASLRLSGDGPGLPERGHVERLRAALAQSGLGNVPLLAATQGYFVEFNRGEPFGLPVDGVAFPVSPTVHSDTLTTVLENGDVIAEMIDAARNLTGRQAVAIAPLTWRHPARATDQPDARAAALWAVAAFIAASRAGAEVVTLGADILRALLELDASGGWLKTLTAAEGSAQRLFQAAGPASFAAFASGVFLAANLGREARSLPLPQELRGVRGEGSDGSACELSKAGDLILPPLTAVHGEFTLTTTSTSSAEVAS